MVTADQLREFFARLTQVIEQHQPQLDRLDAVAGDGDHGATMVMGLRAITTSLPADEQSVPELLRVAAARFASVGGTTGPLWGTALLRGAQSLGATESTALPAIAAAVEAGTQGIADRGRSQEGDKTLLDVMGPASREFAEAVGEGVAPAEALRRASEAARTGLAATRDLEPQHGRARLASDRSRGQEDAGAASAALIWQTAAGE